MNRLAGIRREDKNIWERRVPVIPRHVAELSRRHDLRFAVQPSPIRCFSEGDYLDAGAAVADDLSDCPVVFAVKEMPTEFFRPNGTYIFFAHVIKGQPYNMPMLRRLMDLRCTLIDYERITDDTGRRLVFFGHHAGVAGMIDSLWALGQRLAWEGIASPFARVRRAYDYADSDTARADLALVGAEIAEQGLPAALAPFVCGFAGYGNVSRGAQSIYDILPTRTITPAQLLTIEDANPHVVYKVVFEESDTVCPIDPTEVFELGDYRRDPTAYRSQFEQYLPHLSMLINAIYWAPGNPRLVTNDYLAAAYAGGRQPKLRVIGDISCDVEGGIEATVRATEPDEPVFVFDPATGVDHPGVAGCGPVIMAVDNLPAELPAESSDGFSTVLRDFVPAIVTADYSAPFDECALPPEIKRAVIVYRGELAPAYRYLEPYVS